MDVVLNTLLVELKTWFVEFSQASLFSHQSNWKVKSRAQATEEESKLSNPEISELTFHLAECSVQQVGLVDCQNQPKLFEHMHPHLNRDLTSFPHMALSQSLYVRP